MTGRRWIGAGAGLVAAVVVIGLLSPAAAASGSAGGAAGDLGTAIEAVASVTQVDPALTATATATSIGQEARALSAIAAEWATARTRADLDAAAGVLEQELTRTIPMIDSSARIDRDVREVMAALEGVRADVVATASRTLDAETPGAEASVRETLRAAIADQQADKPVTRETMSALGSLMAAGTAARDSQTASVVEQQRLAAEAAAQAAAETAEAEAAAAVDRSTPPEETTNSEPSQPVDLAPWKIVLFVPVCEWIDPPPTEGPLSVCHLEESAY